MNFPPLEFYFYLLYCFVLLFPLLSSLHPLPDHYNNNTKLQVTYHIEKTAKPCWATIKQRFLIQILAAASAAAAATKK